MRLMTRRRGGPSLGASMTRQACFALRSDTSFVMAHKLVRLAMSRLCSMPIQRIGLADSPSVTPPARRGTGSEAPQLLSLRLKAKGSSGVPKTGVYDPVHARGPSRHDLNGTHPIRNRSRNAVQVSPNPGRRAGPAKRCQLRYDPVSLSRRRAASSFRAAPRDQNTGL
jgi:hypothetical protein